MANTYTQIHIHTVFAVQNRMSLINSSWQDELYKYITGIVQKHGHKLLIINGRPDHLHMLVGMRPIQSLSDLIQDVKGNSSKWINQKRLVKGKFSWQEGFGAFSYSKSQLPQVIKYIERQDEHHSRKTFLQEYQQMLKNFQVEFDTRYIFQEV